MSQEDPVDPVLSAASYWVPRHFPLSAWVEHAPFASWIMDAIRPRVVVELGTHFGFSFFAFAEAAARLSLACELVAIDTWAGDDHAGYYDQDVFRDVERVASSDYPNNTRLVRALFADAVNEFSDGSIDLLHIDGRHGYDDVRTDFELYRPKLSRRGVVLFHDCFEFRDGFGVHRFWDEIAATAPSFRFEHGHGLGVLGVGPEIPARLEAFFAGASADPERTRSEYRKLGGFVSQIFEDRERARRFDALEADASATQVALEASVVREQSLVAHGSQVEGALAEGRLREAEVRAALERARAGRDSALAREAGVRAALERARAGRDSASAREAGVRAALERARAGRDSALEREAALRDSLARARASLQRGEIARASAETELEATRRAVAALEKSLAGASTRNGRAFVRRLREVAHRGGRA